MAGTKNLGQVAGLFIGTSAPSNTTLIWFDSTPAIQCHKVYNQALGQWVVLDNSVISPITYSEIVTLATGDGLTIGQWFKITDQNNVLALAITTTKIQYTDVLANIVIDDLGHNKSYIVSSSNLLIDDLSGVWDSVNNKLVFSFDEVTPAMNDNYYIFGKGKINNVWKFVKFKITKLLSTESGNSISWLNGLYLNFTTKLRTYYNQPGGIVSKDSYDADKTNIQNQINNAANNIQNVAQQAQQNINAAVTDAQIYSKQLPVAPTQQTAVDIVQHDTLQTIILKINNFIQRFKYATGALISNNYSELPAVGSTAPLQIVNNNDSVETAIGKLAATVRRLRSLQGDGTDSVIVSSGYNDNPTSDNQSGAGSVLTRLLEKLRYYSIKHEDTNGIKLDASYAPANNTITAGASQLTDVLEKFAYDISEIFASPWRVPYYSVLIFYRQPIYNNIIGNPTDYQKRIGQFAGKSWFPCGYFFVGSGSDCDAEQAKWDALYGSGSISWYRGFNGSNYALKMTAYHGIVIPDLSGKFLMGYDAINPTDSTYSTIGSTGGANQHQITESEMPRHTHSAGTLDVIGNMSYTYPSTSSGVSGAFSLVSDWSTNIKGSGSDDAWGKSVKMQLSGNWTGTSGYTGGGSSVAQSSNGVAFDNRPAFLTVGYIIRLPS